MLAQGMRPLKESAKILASRAHRTSSDTASMEVATMVDPASTVRTSSIKPWPSGSVSACGHRSLGPRCTPMRHGASSIVADSVDLQKVGRVAKVDETPKHPQTSV